MNIGICYVLFTVFVIVFGQSFTSTYALEYRMKDSNSPKVSATEFNSAYKFRSIYQVENQNMSNDIELEGLVTKVVDGVTLDIN